MRTHLKYVAVTMASGINFYSQLVISAIGIRISDITNSHYVYSLLIFVSMIQRLQWRRLKVGI